MSPSKKAWVVSFGLVLFVLAVENARESEVRLGKENFHEFYSANINGRLMDVQTQAKGAAIYLAGPNSKIIKSKYIFYPSTDQLLNKGHYFNRFAKAGDSIRKPAGHDTLFLIKNGITYKYVFIKIN